MRSIAVASGTGSKKQRVRAYLEARRPAAITGEVWEELLREVGPVSESYLREVLRATGLPFEQPWAGVRQGSFEELEQSLLELRRVYAEASASGRRDLARYCRRQVIAAKDHARFAARKPEKRPEKEEMVEWMLVWLGDPEVFPEWCAIRKRQAGTGRL